MPRMIHQTITDDLRDQASLFSLGLLDESEAAEFAAHLSECAVCATEVRDCTEMIAGVGAVMVEHAAEELPAPPARVKAELLRRISAPPAGASPVPESVIVRANEGRWRKVLPGVEVKRLFVDPVTQTVTSLLRVAAGAVYPAHRHAGLEHLYVIDGDAIFDDHQLDTGDYEARAANSVHSQVTTVEGCTLLVIHNQRDEILR